ncbi:MAG: RNA-protein complex protein Nop10 [Candidatus Woesearchaeota archaeon]
MTSKILKCEKCGSYGLGETCSCGGTRVFSHPPKYSPEDKYAKYRRMAKEQEDEANKEKESEE